MRIDYKEMGLRCGLEIHQQLNTKKLFCNCPSTIVEGEPDKVFTRRLSASEGESGAIDVAALEESKKNKTNEYHFYNSSCCLVEMDEEPPFPMNKDALEIVLQVSKMLNADFVDQIQVMRKTVIDGSNTTGFQRTALVALDGNIDVDDAKIGIESVCIEEDAAKIVERKSDKNIYNLSRLGIPLIEIATSPDIRTPVEAKEVAKKIGMILRSTRKVKRGLGTIRQDLNVSIKGGVRVEIKGVQDLDNIPLLVDNEILRQKNLIELYKKLPDRIIKEDLVDISRFLKGSESKIVSSIIKKGGIFLALKLEDYRGFLGYEIQPNRRYATELSDHAKKYGVKGLFHSDELPNYGITDEDVDNIRKALSCKENDAFILIGEKDDLARKAFKAVIEKLNKRYLEKEVRQALDDGNSKFLRPMPTSSRMYPETDIEPIVPDIDGIEIPELIDDRIMRFEKEYKLNHDLAQMIGKSDHDFDDYVKRYPNIKPMTIASSLMLYPKEIKKRFGIDIDVKEIIDDIFARVNKGDVVEDSIKEMLIEYGNNNSIDFDKYKAVDISIVEERIKKIIEENEGAPVGAIMGMAMKEFRGKVPGKKISEIVNKLK